MRAKEETLKLLNSAGTVLVSSPSSGGDPDIHFTSTATGTYYAELNGLDHGYYTMHAMEGLF